MATLTPVRITRAGVNLGLTAAGSTGDEWANSGREVLFIRNGHATLPRTVTIVTQGLVDQQAIADRQVVVPALATFAIGPFAPRDYNTAGGRTQVTYSDSAADLTVSVMQLSN